MPMVQLQAMLCADPGMSCEMYKKWFVLLLPSFSFVWEGT
jgi:hypothetical protein